MEDLEEVHSFRDHAVAGVNWRPMKIFDKLPRLRVCDLCRMIPKRIQLLPCRHILCEACHAASSQDSGDGLCPLDRKPFVGAECIGISFPVEKASVLKVYCWNEAHGCVFVGTTKDTLEHYENECTYHIVNCLRCGDGVRHRDLCAHYASGCSSGLSSKGANCDSLKSAAAIVRDVRASVEKMNAMLMNPDRDQLMPSIQTRMNQLALQMREHESRLDELTLEVRASAEAEGADVAAASSSKMADQSTCRSETMEEQASSMTSLELQSPEMWNTCISQFFYAKLPRDVLKAMRRTSPQEDYPQHAVLKRRSQDVKCILYLAEPMSTTRSWMEVHGSVRYLLHLRNIDTDPPTDAENIICAQVTVLHTSDAYFTVEVSMNCLVLFVRTEFRGMRGSLQCSGPFLRVKVYDGDVRNGEYLPAYLEPCPRKRGRDPLVHFHRTSSVQVDYLQRKGFLRDRKMEFEIELSRTETEHSQL
ncbi:uncharacterized protein LOC119407278 isoform X1 [Rhipicephalus sanguineus]|uniref:uncharacterized protein LOC119407278 isoform X1 n=2 Tax=Rhipicephalus sanguineus TaxID=34632 RepID=UPI0020C25C79|nr:uncharacterized protein LOC119407278 isoform X1 [Rhipicephalus sanguineus]